MAKVKFDLSISLDGYVAGPDQSLDDPLGKGGEQLHEWAVATAAFKRAHGHEGGEVNADDEVAAELLDGVGATVMGRHMFSGGEGPWDDDPNALGWWGDEPPFHHPVFILTHHAREPVVMAGGTTFTFVTDGIESALEQARDAAGEQDVAIGGGGAVAQQYLRTGLVDEFQVHIVPVLLGGGVRLLDGIAEAPGRVECVRQRESPTGVAHLKYRVVR
jgi:dihydrofolate reductase